MKDIKNLKIKHEQQILCDRILIEQHNIINADFRIEQILILIHFFVEFVNLWKNSSLSCNILWFLKTII